MKNILKIYKPEIFFYVFVFIFISILTLSYNTIDMDLWARLIQGNAFLQTGHILKEDLFSYIPTHIWIDHEWGSSIVFSFVLKHFGFNGILLLRTAIIFLMFFFIFQTIKLYTEKQNTCLNVLYFTAAVYAMPTLSQSGLRCHFFTFLFFTVFLYVLELVRKRNKNKLLIILPIIMLFWANMHGGCVSGLGLIGIYAAGEFLNKRPFKKYIYTLLACLLMLFINPYGFDYVKFIFMASTMPRPFVTEWISPFIHPDWNFLIEFKVLYILNLIILLCNLKHIRTDCTKYILLFVCAVLSAMYVKNTPFFIIVSMIFLYENILGLLNSFIEKHTKKIYLFFASLILLFPLKQCFENITYTPLSQQPVRAVEFFRINKLSGNILAPFDYGSYIIYKLYPNNLIYMDGRYEEVYYTEQKELIDNFYNLKGNWAKILDNAQHDYIIVPSDALLNDFLFRIKDYVLIYNDGENCIYGKKAKLLKQYKIPSKDYNYYFKHAFDTNIRF